MKGMFAFAAVALGLAASAQAGVATLGKGDSSRFDPAAFPAAMKKRYEIMEVKCTNKSCHTLGRVVEAITTGVAPNTRTLFDKEAAKRYGIKMMRNTNANVSKEEAKQIVELLYYMIDEARK